MARSTAPIPNEAWFWSPADNLVRHGHMGTTNLVTHGTWLAGIERRTYWIPPLHILAQAAWYLAAGSGLAQQRALSIGWGLVALAMAYLMGVRLRLGRWAALLGVALLATDFRWVLAGSLGRMDMMCAALGLGGVAAYLHLRRVSLTRATLVGHSLVAASCLTHPCGVVHGLGLALVMLCLDGRQLNLRLAAVAGLPYILGLAGLGVYILQDPNNFLQQFRGNVSGLANEAGRGARFDGLQHPWQALVAEISRRYLEQFGNWGGGRFFGGLQMYVLGLYLAAAVAALVNPRLRRSAAGRALAALALGSFCSFWLLDGSKASGYLPHILPWMLLLAGFGLRRLAAGQTALVASLVAVVVAGQCAAFLGWTRKNSLQNEATAAVRYLETHVAPGERLDGGAEYGLLAKPGLVFFDDPRLGFLTGERPDWIVMSGWYGTWIEASRKRDAKFDGYVRRLLDHGSREVFHAGKVKIFRTGPAPSAVIQ